MSDMLVYTNSRNADFKTEIERNESRVHLVLAKNKRLAEKIDNIQGEKCEVEKKYHELLSIQQNKCVDIVVAGSSNGTTPLIKDEITGSVVLNRPKFTCTVDNCGKTYEIKRSFNRHMQRHKTVFVCDVCKESFNQKSDLSRHMLRHTGAKPFSCPICLKKCAQKSNLTSHIKTHVSKNKKKLT